MEFTCIHPSQRIFPFNAPVTTGEPSENKLSSLDEVINYAREKKKLIANALVLTTEIDLIFTPDELIKQWKLKHWVCNPEEFVFISAEQYASFVKRKQKQK